MSGIPTSNSKSNNHKHVSRACLECRSRHLKCGGQEPECDRCKKHNRTCTYVKSHRGGSRKKGVSLKNKMKLLSATANAQSLSQDPDADHIINNSTATATSSHIDNHHRRLTDGSTIRESNNQLDGISDSENENKGKMVLKSYSMDSVSDINLSNSNLDSMDTTPTDLSNHPVRNHKSEMLPCVKNGLGHMADHPNCKESCLHVENFNSMPQCLKLNMSDSTEYKKIHMNKINYHPIFNGSQDDDPINIIFDEKKKAASLDDCYITPGLIKDLNIENIISSFYNSFYTAHPFLPPKEHILAYLDAIPYNYDLLLGMKIMAEGQTTSKYARDIETVNYLVISIVSYIRQIGKDFISLQSLLLLAMITHISSLHDLSTLIREAAISLALEMKLNFVDENNVSSVFLDVNGFISERNDSSNRNVLNTPSDTDSKNQFDSLFNSERVMNIPHDILIETMRKTFWELYYFDSISGTASGHTKSRLAVQHCLVLYPTSISLNTFDYKSRAEACKLVNDAISLNISIQSNADSLPHLNHMKAALGNWEMKLANPDTYGMPYLINKYGIVNDGLFEAIMLLNYARIFTHRPFSYLWRADVSKHPRCTDEKGIDDPCPPLNNKESQTSTDARKIIETRKTIDSANFLMKTLLDTDPGQTCKRTPFLACALAFSCLVHLSAYAWVESNLSLLDSIDETNKQISSSELEIYTEYIKLEIGSTLQISRHWSLSAKLITHIAETLSRVSPKLYKKVQAGILGLGFNLSSATGQPVSNSNGSMLKSDSETSKTKMIKAVSSNTFDSEDKSRIQTDGNITDLASSPQSLTRTTGSQSKLFVQPIPNYMMLANQQQYNSNNNNNNNTYITSASKSQRQPQLYQEAPHVSNDQLSNYNSNSNNSNNNDNNANSNNPVNNGNTNNNFMMEFNDLVNSMNNANQGDDNYSSTVIGFPPEPQDYGFLDPMSPTSDTGCDWVDKHVFQFDTFSLANGA